MKQTLFFISVIFLLCISSCSTMKPVNYADREWRISNHYGQIIDTDTTYRMTIGRGLVYVDQPIISCADSAAKYPGMERFVADILHTAGLESDELLFYAPAHGMMFVRLLNEPPVKQPSTFTVNLESLPLEKDYDKPFTSWVYDDDVDHWHRQKGEMYTYTYFDRKKKRVLIVDFYDYGETPIAQIFVHQSRNKKTDRMQLPPHFWSYYKHDLKNYERDIEFWSHQVDLHRENAFENYKIGQEQLKQRQ